MHHTDRLVPFASSLTGYWSPSLAATHADVIKPSEFLESYDLTEDESGLKSLIEIEAEIEHIRELSAANEQGRTIYISRSNVNIGDSF